MKTKALRIHAPIRLIFIVLLTLLCAHSVAAVPPPNIIFVLADDLGYGDLGGHGSPIVRTPNILFS